MNSLDVHKPARPDSDISIVLVIDPIRIIPDDAPGRLPGAWQHFDYVFYTTPQTSTFSHVSYVRH